MGGPYYLQLGPVDLTNITESSLKFKRWLNVDYQPYVTAAVEVSNDGSNWDELWSNGSSTVTESAWSSQEYDISETADGQSTVYIRWSYQVGYYAYAYSGWNIDDVEIWGLGPSGPQFSAGDMNCDGVVDNFDIDPFVLVITGTPPDYTDYYLAYPECDHMLGDVNADGTVNNFDIDPFVALLNG